MSVRWLDIHQNRLEELNNYFQAGGGNDEVRGLGGADVFDGLDGNDLLIGGPGDDVYQYIFFGVPMDTDTIDETGGGQDVIEFLQDINGVTFDAGNLDPQVVSDGMLTIDLLDGSTLEHLKGESKDLSGTQGADAAAIDDNYGRCCYQASISISFLLALL